MKGHSFLAFVSGAALGTAVALLFAPEKGRKTRRKLKDMYHKEQEMLMQSLKKCKRELPEEIQDIIE
ncbi:MAG: YtxH domain-containing protein [Rikenellaceae bacterium]|nr:YtxH domain-containing protein [Rikenellaceae bacterium]